MRTATLLATRLVSVERDSWHGLQCDLCPYREQKNKNKSFTILRVIFCLVAHLDLHCKQTDVNCAFLYADVDDEIYMDQPEGFCQRGDTGEPVVCLLKKSIYGRS
jgi:hypothetical protein